MLNLNFFNKKKVNNINLNNKFNQFGNLLFRVLKNKNLEVSADCADVESLVKSIEIASFNVIDIFLNKIKVIGTLYSFFYTQLKLLPFFRPF